MVSTTCPVRYALAAAFSPRHSNEGAMIDVVARTSFIWRSCFSAFWIFCLRSRKHLTRRANQEHKDIVEEFVNARRADDAAGILLSVAACDHG